MHGDDGDFDGVDGTGAREGNGDGDDDDGRHPPNPPPATIASSLRCPLERLQKNSPELVIRRVHLTLFQKDILTR